MWLTLPGNNWGKSVQDVGGKKHAGVLFTGYLSGPLWLLHYSLGLGIVSPTVGWALILQLPMKTLPHRHCHRPHLDHHHRLIYLRHSSIEGPSSQVTPGCVKLKKKKKTNQKRVFHKGGCGSKYTLSFCQWSLTQLILAGQIVLLQKVVCCVNIIYCELWLCKWFILGWIYW